MKLEWHVHHCQFTHTTPACREGWGRIFAIAITSAPQRSAAPPADKCAAEELAMQLTADDSYDANSDSRALLACYCAV